MKSLEPYFPQILLIDERSILWSLIKSFDTADTSMSHLVVSALMLNNGCDASRNLWYSLLVFSSSLVPAVWSCSGGLRTEGGKHSYSLSCFVHFSSLTACLFQVIQYYKHFPLKIMSITKTRDIQSHSSPVTTHIAPHPNHVPWSSAGLPLSLLRIASFPHWTTSIIFFTPSQCLSRSTACACGKPHSETVQES